MNQNDLPQAEKVRANIAGLYAALGKPYEKFRPVWACADSKARRAFLKIAGLPEVWANREWDGLGRHEREQLKVRVFAMRDWLNNHLAGCAA